MKLITGDAKHLDAKRTDVRSARLAIFPFAAFAASHRGRNTTRLLCRDIGDVQGASVAFSTFGVGNDSSTLSWKKVIVGRVNCAAATRRHPSPSSYKGASVRMDDMRFAATARTFAQPRSYRSTDEFSSGG